MFGELLRRTWAVHYALRQCIPLSSKTHQSNVQYSLKSDPKSFFYVI